MCGRSTQHVLDAADRRREHVVRGNAPEPVGRRDVEHDVAPANGPPDRIVGGDVALGPLDRKPRERATTMGAAIRGYEGGVPAVRLLERFAR